MSPEFEVKEEIARPTTSAKIAALQDNLRITLENARGNHIILDAMNQILKITKEEVGVEIIMNTFCEYCDSESAKNKKPQT